MKNLIFMALATSLGWVAHAETQLTCWNMYSKKGSKPIMKAHIEDETTLSNITFNMKDDNFSLYIIDKTEDSGEQWQHKPAVTKSSIVNPKDAQTPHENETKSSPYYHDNEYDFQAGTYSFTSPYYNAKGTYDFRLILPKDLSNENLKTFRIRSASERSNAVIIMPPPYGSDQEGQGYLRMFCSSK